MTQDVYATNILTVILIINYLIGKLGPVQPNSVKKGVKKGGKVSVPVPVQPFIKLIA